MVRLEWFDLLYYHKVIDKRTSFYLSKLPEDLIEYNTPAAALNSFDHNGYYENQHYWITVYNDVIRWWNKNKDKFKNGQLKIEL